MTDNTEPGGPISIIVPTYKEAENLPHLLERIGSTMAETGRAYEVVIVDDDSRDGTESVCAELSDKGYPVRLVVRVDKRGLSSAVLRGFREARGEVMVCMDADLSHPPEAIPEIVRTLEQTDADFVIGSRYVAGGSTEDDWGFFRLVNSKVATWMALPFTRAKDPMAGFFGLTRQTFESADFLNPIGYKIGLELIVKCCCKHVREVPIHFSDRKFGTSKLNVREQINYLKHIKRLADYKYRNIALFGQFCLVGGMGAVIDLAIYAILLAVNTPLMAARAIAIWLAMTFNFALNRRLTFSFSRKQPVLKPCLRFVATCSLGAVINWAVSVGLARRIAFFERHLLLAAVVGILAGTISNFVMSRFWVFKQPGSPAEGAPY